MMPPPEIVLWLGAQLWAEVCVEDLVPIWNVFRGEVKEFEAVLLFALREESTGDPAKALPSAPPFGESGNG